MLAGESTIGSGHRAALDLCPLDNARKLKSATSKPPPCRTKRDKGEAPSFVMLPAVFDSALGTLVMLPVCQPRLSHFQGGGFRGNWCRYGERIDNPKRHSESGEVVAAHLDSLHRGARLRAGGKTLLVRNPRNRDHGNPLWGGMLQGASWAWLLHFFKPVVRAGSAPVPRLAGRAPQDDKGFEEIACGSIL